MNTVKVIVLKPLDSHKDFSKTQNWSERTKVFIVGHFK